MPKKKPINPTVSDNDPHGQSDHGPENQPLRGRPSVKVETLRSRFPKPVFVEPMKPLLVTALPEGHEWRYELKWDGFRALLLKVGEDVRLLSRNNKSLSAYFPGVLAAAKTIKADTCG